MQRILRLQYYLGVFSPETWLGFRAHGNKIIGFPSSKLRKARSVQLGDTIVGYLSGLSRWCGAFTIAGKMYRDSSPVFVPARDRFSIRFDIDVEVLLDPENAIPIDELWNALHRTRHIPKGTVGWATRAGMLSSLARLEDADGVLLVQRLALQAFQGTPYPLTAGDDSLLHNAQTQRERALADQRRVG
jgi:hypothetical protein